MTRDLRVTFDSFLTEEMEKEAQEEAILRRVYLTKDLYIQVYPSKCILRTVKGHCVFSVNGDENAVLAHQCFGSCGQCVRTTLPIKEMLIADNHCVTETGKIHLCYGECSRHPGATHQVLRYGLYGAGKRHMMREVRKQDARYDEEDRICAHEYVKKNLAYFATLENVKEPETRKELLAVCNEQYGVEAVRSETPLVISDTASRLDLNMDEMLRIYEEFQEKYLKKET